MGYDYRSEEEHRLQKKLIPLNIFVAIISLVSAVTLLFTPLLKINIGKVFEIAASQTAYVQTDDSVSHTGTSINLDGSDEENEGGNEDGGNHGNNGNHSNNSTPNEKTVLSLIAKMFDADIVISPMTMARVLFAPEEEKGLIIFEDFLINNGLLQNMVVSMLNVTVVLATELVGDDEIMNIDFGKIIDEFMKIDNVNSSAEFEAIIDEYVSLLELEIGENLDAETKEQVMKMCDELYDTTVAHTEDGSFSVEKMICVMTTKDSGHIATSYEELIDNMMEGITSFEGVSAVIEPLNTAAPAFGYVFIFIAVAAGTWFVLFLFSFLRIFAKNKRFMTWYVKLIGCWPCIIFGVFPLAFSGLLGSALGNMAGILSAITTFTWISGICYLLLWAVSICWAFPIKSKIRKMRKY